jgi:hypothetical protein
MGKDNNVNTAGSQEIKGIKVAGAQNGQRKDKVKTGRGDKTDREKLP